MAVGITMARPYAKALFGLAKEENLLADWQTALKIDRELMNNVVAADFLSNPGHSAAEKLKLFADVHAGFTDSYSPKLGQVHQHFIQLLLQYGRIFVLEDIYHLYKKMVAQEAGILNVQIDSAQALNPQAQQKLEQRLQQFFHKDIKAHYMQKPELLGGALIKTNQWVLDGSVRGAIERLRDHLKAIAI